MIVLKLPSYLNRCAHPIFNFDVLSQGLQIGMPSDVDTRLPDWIDIERGRQAPTISEQVYPGTSEAERGCNFSERFLDAKDPAHSRRGPIISIV